MTPDKYNTSIVFGDAISNVINMIARSTINPSSPNFSFPSVVGGTARDICMGLVPSDIHLSTGGGVKRIASKLLSTLGGRVLSYNTTERAFRWLYMNKAWDIRQAHGEIYEAPAAKPKPNFGVPFIYDLLRRDFSINAIAMEVNPNGNLYVYDPYMGQDDLENKTLSVIHPKSFMDDPTRIIRGLRFIHRFGFRFSSKTENLIGEAIPVLYQIETSRAAKEIRRFQHEVSPPYRNRLLNEYNLIDVVDNIMALDNLARTKKSADA